MPAPVDSPQKRPAISKLAHSPSAIKLIVILAIMIFLSEIIALVVIDFIGVKNYLVTTLLDGIIMLLLILPGLYFLYFKPLWIHMGERTKAEEALRSSEKLLKRILELLPVGVFITNKNGTVVQSNQAGDNLWAGTRYVDVPNYGEYKAWWTESGKPVEPEEWAAARAIANKETIIGEEVNIEAFDGTHKIILNSAVPILDEQNNLQGAVIVNQDITSQKNAQRALEESEKLFRTAMDYLPVGVWLTDGTGEIIYGNPEGQTIWVGARYVGKENYGEYKGWWLNTGKPVEPGDWAVARAITKGETSLNEELEIECFDGTHKIILNSAIPIRDDEGNILRAFIVNQDITERKKHERAIIQSNELMNRYFSCISTLIAYMDRDFNFIRVNEAYANSAGHPAEFLVGRNHFDLYPNEENEAIFRGVVETGEPYVVYEKPFEYKEYPERGVTYWDWSLQPVKDTDGTVEGLVLSLVDVTVGKNAQIELEHKNQELLELSQAERRQRELAESLVQASVVLNTSLDQEMVLNGILEQIRKTIPFSGANILLLEDEFMRVASYLGYENTPKDKLELSVERSYLIEDFPVHKKICDSLQPAKIDSVIDCPDWRYGPGFEWIRSYLGVPLLLNKEVIGIISLTSEYENAFSQEALDHLLAFTAPAALAIHNAGIFKEESTARQAAEILAAAAQALTNTLDLKQVINTLLDHINLIVYSDTAGVTMLENETHMTIRSSRGYGSWAHEENIPTFFVEGMSDTIIQQIVVARKSLTLTNQASYLIKQEHPDCQPVCNWLVVPILANDKLAGLVELGRVKPNEFTPEQIQWAEVLVGQAAAAIQNAWLFQEVRSASERLQSLARKLVEVQENERYWIARELHDEAGQALSVLKMHLGRLAQDRDCPPHIRQNLEELKGRTDSVLEELHRLAMDLRPVALDHLGLVAALEQFASNLNSDRMAVQFKALGFEEERLQKDLEASLYRIVQEALANVIRHARACNVGILLKRDKDKVKVFVEDDGIGFEPNLSEGSPRLGLIGMRERAEMFGGTLTIESCPGEGTSIIVEVPYVN